MEQSDKKSEIGLLIGNNTMVRINGAGVKSLRESKGLTQLYLATVIGVTTDTISRWENNKYPAIKLENAEKLALALEVEIESFLNPVTELQEDLGENKKSQDQESAVDVMPAVGSDIESQVIAALHSKVLWLVLGVIILVFSFVSIQLFNGVEQKVGILAERVVPPHVPAGQSFPVLVRVDLGDLSRVSVILREFLPGRCSVLCTMPVATILPGLEGELKWIRQVEGGKAIFVYTLQSPDNIKQNEKLLFSGSLVLQKTGGDGVKVDGDTVIRVDSYHWADTNRDSKIDDEEILAVYDLYGEQPAIEFNRDLIDDIWAADGYSWDEEKKTYKIRR
ncbi:MAG: helix-turn-helix domain-containing protein [Desulfobulbaceae bacterium]|nr:helix-turn-helix domain-containing protein [Desulfobulbaceae bacterium]